MGLPSALPGPFRASWVTPWGPRTLGPGKGWPMGSYGPEGHRGDRWDRLYRWARWLGPLYTAVRAVREWV
ncbi:hypothetical protein GCM10009544_38410 [Streptomyces stramineus]|uniref:Uncharacterized protein n=1 Tax=Streptomyces stramineus TaxID=173861 RepID=A0ABN1AC10_9ACTN